MSLRPPASPDPADNPRFSAILAKAREVAYPKANLDAAIAKVRFSKPIAGDGSMEAHVSSLVGA
jgi:transcriptional/translational regulatory protein YebC/TACO1